MAPCLKAKKEVETARDLRAEFLYTDSMTPRLEAKKEEVETMRDLRVEFLYTGSMTVIPLMAAACS